MGKIRDKQTEEGKKFQKMLQELNQLEVRIGVQEGESYPDGTRVLDVALWNELGTEQIPSRPFLRNSVDAHEEEIRHMIDRIKKLLLKGGSAEEALKYMGEKQKKIIQKEIVEGNFAPNARITVQGGWMKNKKSGKFIYVKGKQSEQPLIDTGTLRQSIHSVIQKKGKGNE